jgi:RHS repeat-associated protein
MQIRPGQYFNNETGLFYNYFRGYDPQTGRYIQSDPIGLAGGISPYAYVEGNPLSNSDPFALWSISIAGYAPWGGGIVFGRDPNSGGGFFAIRGGYGIGGGFKWDPRGGRPGSRAQECETGGWGIGGFGDVQFNEGPVQASLQSNAGINFFNQIGRAPNPYRQLFVATFSIGDSWGIKAEAAAGGELTFFSPKNPGSDSKCGCP